MPKFSWNGLNSDGWYCRSKVRRVWRTRVGITVDAIAVTRCRSWQNRIEIGERIGHAVRHQHPRELCGEERWIVRPIAERARGQRVTAGVPINAPIVLRRGTGRGINLTAAVGDREIGSRLIRQRTGTNAKPAGIQAGVVAAEEIQIFIRVLVGDGVGRGDREQFIRVLFPTAPTLGRAVEGTTCSRCRRCFPCCFQPHLR